MVCCFPSELAYKSFQVLGELVGRSTNVANNGPWRYPLFTPLYSLGGLKSVGHSCLFISSVSVNFLRSVVFLSIDSEGSKASLV
jgi:hypothetical protein